MSDPAIFGDEAVVTLNELPYLDVGRHFLPSASTRSKVNDANGATAATRLSHESVPEEIASSNLNPAPITEGVRRRRHGSRSRSATRWER